MNLSSKSNAAAQPVRFRRRNLVFLLFLVVATFFLYSRYQKSQTQADGEPVPALLGESTEIHSATSDASLGANPYGLDSDWAINSDVATTSAGGDQTEVTVNASGSHGTRGDDQPTVEVHSDSE